MALLLAGCLPDTRQIAKDQEGKKDADAVRREEGRQLQSGAGTVDRLDENGKPAYRVKFSSSQLRFDEKGIFEGGMDAVSGTLIGEDGSTTTFSATRAFAEKASDQLRLEGKVQLDNAKQTIRLTCDELVWNRKARRVEAKGNVRVDGENYELGPASEVWADPQLEEIASPGLFRKP